MKICRVRKVRTLFFNGGSRSSLLKFNIVAMLLIKGMTVIISFILLPLTIGYVSSSVYGIWLSLSSIVAWIGFFDIGLNNGLRNRFAECKAEGNFYLAKKYVSTTYVLLIIIFIPIIIVALLLNNYIDWAAFLNIKDDSSINSAVSIIIIYFGANFIFSTINIIFTADMKPAYASLLNLLQQILTLIIILALVRFTGGSLLRLCLALCLSPLFVLILFNVYFFKGRYQIFSPSLTDVDFSLMRDLFSLGYRFFVIQAACIMLFQSSNFVVIKYYGADAVTMYNVSYKYFFALNMVFSILIAPLWSAVTDARTRQDDSWIRKMLKKYTKIALLFVFGGAIMLLLCDQIYKIWMGEVLGNIPFLLSLSMYIFVCENILANLYAMFLNGAGILKLQFLFCCISPLLFVFLCYIFIRIFIFDVYCIPIAIVLSNVYGLLVSPVQCYLVFYKNKKGIWVR